MSQIYLYLDKNKEYSLIEHVTGDIERDISTIAYSGDNRNTNDDLLMSVLSSDLDMHVVNQLKQSLNAEELSQELAPFINEKGELNHDKALRSGASMKKVLTYLLYYKFL